LGGDVTFESQRPRCLRIFSMTTSSSPMILIPPDISDRPGDHPPIFFESAGASFSGIPLRNSPTPGWRKPGYPSMNSSALNPSRPACLLLRGPKESLGLGMPLYHGKKDAHDLRFSVVNQVRTCYVGLEDSKKEKEIPMKKMMIFLTVLLLAVSFSQSLWAAEDEYSEVPAAWEKVGDILWLRPIGFIGTLISASAYVISLPVTVHNKESQETMDSLVKDYSYFTFERPLGGTQVRQWK
jgi:hypothetical protein